jgi:Cu/Ag efflux pump CusA
MDRVVARMAGELRALPGVRDVGAHVGRAVTSDQIVGTSSGQIWVNFGRSSAKTLHAVQRVVAGYPGVGTKVESYFNQRITDGEEAAGPPVVVRLSGEDYGTLHAKADQIVGVLSRVKGIVHPTVEAQPMQPVIDVQVNIDAAERVGIKPGDIRRAASALLAGIEVGSLYQDQKVFQVEVLGTSTTRQSLNAVQDLLLDTPSGGHVRLGDVASVRIQPGLTTIKHTDVTRTLDVTAQVHGRTTGAVLHDVAKQVAGVAFPLNYHANVLGHEENQTAAYHRVLLAALAAAVLLLLLLQAAAESWSAAACLLVLVSAGVGAGLFAAWLDTGTVGVGAVAGLLAVGGVSVKQSLLAIEGRRAGVWPALATLPIFVAVMFAGDVAGTEILRPMAPVVILGVVASTVASLLAPPIVERWVRHA